MTGNTLPFHVFEVRAVVELEELARRHRADAIVLFAVAVAAFISVVRLLVALHAIGGGGQAHGRVVAGVADVAMTLNATDARDGVFAVLERPRRVTLLQPEHAGT